MDASKITSKTSSLKALILKAWRERWTDIQWGINIKTILPRGVSGDLYNLADCILQQAMVGCGANQLFKAPVTIHETLQKISNMDVDKIAPLNGKTESVTHLLQAMIVINVLADPGADMQQLSSQLLMVQRIKGYSLSRLYCELIRACFISLNDSSKDASKQALWAAFTFLKIPQVIHYLHSLCGTTSKEGEFSEEVIDAFEQLLQSTPLLDIVDTKNSCNSVVSLLEPLVKLNVVLESHLTYFSQKRENKDLKLQKLEPTGLPGSVPAFITRAEPTLAGILKTMGGDFQKTQESLYVMLCQIVGGTTLDTILAVATVEGKLKLFVSRLIKFNEFALKAASEKGAPQSKIYIFDISFLILCAIVQDYGADAVLEENGESFFEQWVRDCMPHKGVHKPPEEIIQKCDPQIVDIFIHHLSAPDFDFKNTNLITPELCMNVSGTVREVLFAWEQGSLTATDVKRMLESLRQKMASLAVCASVWLCSYINVVHQDAFLKPINMVQQFVTLSETELTQPDNFKERAALMCQIIKRMQYDIHPPSAPKSKNLTYSHNIVSRQPILEHLQSVWEDIKSRGYLHIDATHVVESLLNTAGPVWFVNNLVKETLKYRYQEDLDRSVDVVLAMFHLDIENCTEALLLHVLPQYLYNTKLCEELVEPQSAVLAKLSVYSIYAALEHSNITKGLSSRKRRHEDSDEGDGSSSKVRRLNDNSTESTSSTSFPPSQPSSSGITLNDPLQTALETLYTSFSQLAGKNGDVTPQTHFILQFLVYLVQCGGERAQLVLQKMPSELVPTLIKALPDCFNINLVLRLYDLSTPYGRKDTARDLCLLRNMRLRPD
ncbi:mediator of RNA polymerase II transcription subunit 24 [Phthorimaea operculella]|nr:mediator of RNA polymerase II transcription subunit 24 [Phthorimaea operculella]